MGTTLQHGIFLPAEGERNCYAGLASNWTTIDGVVGGYSSHAANLTIHVTAADKEAWNGKADASALTAHTGNTTIHVTAADKEAWNGKADASALTAHTGNTTIHVTAADKEAWNGKADDADVVHKAGNETVGGIKTFSSDIRISKTSPFCNLFSSGYIKGQAPTSNMYSGVRFFDDINSGSTNTITGGFEVEFNKDGYNKSYISSRNYAGEKHKVFNVGLRVPNDDIRSTDFLPSVSNIVNLGTSTIKWKTLNGINPGALSLPDLTAGVDISAYITDITGASNINKFTPTADGWISIGLSNADFIEIYIPSNLMGASFAKNTLNNSGLAFMPVIANKEVKIALKGSSIGWAKFYPCQGNV